MAKKPGKYAHVIGGLPKTFGHDASAQDKIDKVKEQLTSEEGCTLNAEVCGERILITSRVNKDDVTVLAKEYIRLRAEKDKINNLLSGVQLQLDAVIQLMSDQFEAKTITQMEIAGQPIYYNLSVHPQVTDKEAFRLWCMADADLVRMMQLWPSRMQSLTRQRLAAGEPEPPGVTVFSKPTFKRGSEE